MVLVVIIELVVYVDWGLHELWHNHGRRRSACKGLLLGQRIGVCLRRNQCILVWPTL